MKYSVKLKISLFVCLLLLAVSACGRFDLEDKGNAPSSSEETPAATENLVTANSEPAEVVRKSFEKLSAARSFRAQSETISPDMVTLKNNEEFVSPDRYHGIQTNTGLETIIIGKNTYLKSSNSNWEKTDFFEVEGDKQLLSDEAIRGYLKQIPKDNKEYKVLGSETIDGLPAMIYQFSYSLSNLSEKTPIMTMKMWIGTRDNLPYKIENELEGNLGGESFRIKTVTKYYDFGADIKIEPPV